jgi:hypothetical protein
VTKPTRIHFEQDEPLSHTLFAFAERSLPADEVGLVERHEPIESTHARRVGLRELRVPDAIRLLQAEAVDRAISDETKSAPLAGLPQILQEHPMLVRRDHDLVAQLTGQRNPPDDCARRTDIQHLNGQEREHLIRHVAAHEPLEDRARRWPGQ